MFPEIDFDTLSEKANADSAVKEDKNKLYGQVFSLPEWFFIARGELPNINPYIASNTEVAGGQYMIRAFTDTMRLHRFAAENNLLSEDGTSAVLSIPTEGIVEFLKHYIDQGVYGIWFNSDNKSFGFYVPCAQLQPIKSHLHNTGWNI